VCSSDLAGSNPSAGAYDSKTVFAFTNTENWQHHTSSASLTIPNIPAQLDTEDDNTISGEYLINASTRQYDPIAGVLTATPVFQANSDNSIFYKPSRSNRYERCRFLNNVILIKGNDSNLTISEDSGPTEDHFVVESGSNHIHLTGANIDFTRNSPTDQLKLAFSLINKNGNSLTIPDTVRILVDFASTDTSTGEFARFEAEINQGSSGNLENSIADFETNRYFVITKQLQELYTSANFTWNAVTVVKIYACVIDGGVPSADYYVALDAVRLENVATVNPLYGMTGYSIIKTEGAETIVKSPNTSNYIEFRFSVGVT
jgi:hypothetical protein